MIRVQAIPSNPLPTSTALDDGGIPRVSISHIVQEQGFEYGIPRGWETLVEGSGAVTLDDALRNVRFSIGTADGERALLQLKSKVRWRWGHSMALFLTGVLNHGNTSLAGGTKIRWGYFDDQDGQFLELSASGAFLVFRSSTSGAPVDVAIPQSAWSSDRFDGAGPSKFDVNWAKVQRIWHSASSPGGGRGQFGLYVQNRLVQALQISSINSRDDVPFLRTVLLSPRIELINVGAGSGAVSQLYSTAMLEEGPLGDETGYISATGTGVSGVSVNSTAYMPLLSLRLRDTMENFQMRGKLELTSIQILNTGQSPIHLRVIENASLTAPSWALLDSANSLTEVDFAATGLTGGYTIASGFAGNTAGNSTPLVSIPNFPSKVYLGRSAAGARDSLTVAARGIGGSSVVHADISLHEVY